MASTTQRKKRKHVRSPLELQHDNARLQYETAQYETALQMMQQTNQPIREAWGDFIDPTERLNDAPGFGDGGLDGLSVSSVHASDRADGRFLPVYQSEQDLLPMLAIVRAIVTSDPMAISLLDNLTNYTIGTGLNYQAVSTDKNTSDPRLVADVQQVLNTFLEDNDWESDFEREVFARTRTDGEAILSLIPEGWRTRVKIIEPEQLTEPADPRDLEEWLHATGQADLGAFVPSWSFGILTRLDEATMPIGYHVVNDGRGDDWEFLPDAHVEHIKRNVPRSAKRGVSDFLPVYRYLRSTGKLLDNMIEGGAIQAAIAWIREHAQGTQSGQAASLLGANRFTDFNQPRPKLGSQTVNVQRYGKGTILDTGPGTIYKPAPLGSSHAPNFTTIIQAGLRYVANRWNMPEFMTGDASNANYASTLVAESPFIKGRENDQRFYCSRFKRLIWKVIRIAFDAGYFSSWQLSWEELRQTVRLNIVPPEVATRDKLKQAQTAEIEIRMGTLSRRTATAEAGRDFDAEIEKRKTELE